MITFLMAVLTLCGLVLGVVILGAGITWLMALMAGDRMKEPESLLWPKKRLYHEEHKNLGTDVFGDPINRKEWGLTEWNHGPECKVCNPPPAPVPLRSQRGCATCGVPLLKHEYGDCTPCVRRHAREQRQHESKKTLGQLAQRPVLLDGILVREGAHINVEEYSAGMLTVTLYQGGARFAVRMTEERFRDFYKECKDRFTVNQTGQMKYLQTEQRLKEQRLKEMYGYEKRLMAYEMMRPY